MKYTNDSHIDCIDEVKEFFCYLINDLRVSVHPDNDFSEYVETGTGKPTFSEEEVATGNRLMDECLCVCEKDDIDIYELCLPILKKATFGEN